MASKSKLRKLPDELRQELDRLLSDGKMTIREITEILRSRGAEVSKSAVGRYSQTFEEIAKDIRHSRMMAEALTAELEGVPDQNVGRLVVASLEGLLLRAQRQLVDDDGNIDTKALGSMSTAVRDLQAALKSNVDTEMKIRKAFAAEAAEKVEARLVTERGISREVIDGIKADVLGLARKS